MAKKSRMSVLKRQREARKSEKAALKRERRETKKTDGGGEPSEDDLAAYLGIENDGELAAAEEDPE